MKSSSRDGGGDWLAAAAATAESASAREESAFAVPFWLDWLGGLVDRHPRFWLRLGRLETGAVAADLNRVSVAMPVYVCGLARSGSTLLHEAVAAHPAVATHRIKDYPFVFTPYWWRRATAGLRPTARRERAHGDRMMVSSESPDALEEMLWMAFFRQCHNPGVSNVLQADERFPAFESFYKAHLAKLLLAERATRYAAKANYHVARLAYLVRLFSDAKVLLPVRSPVDHVASLLRQHERFSQGQRQHPRALAYMQRSGHFEFGLDRRPLNLGDASRVEQVARYWAQGDDVRGFAAYWDMVYGYLARLLADDDRVRAATLVVRYETLCDSPAETLHAVLRHVGLQDSEAIVEKYAAAVRRPDYYASKLTSDDKAAIGEATAATAALWGYC